jgi:hypothetical protein
VAHFVLEILFLKLDKLDLSFEALEFEIKIKLGVFFLCLLDSFELLRRV